MDREEFNSLLDEAGITKKRFCHLVDSNYITVNNWGSNNKNIPSWVKSWFDLYIENKEYKDFKELLEKSGVCKDKKPHEDKKEEV